MAPALVSCIIPAFNAEAHLAEVINSIARQTDGPTEIIVVDDGSTDATPAVIERYGARIVGLRQANAGPAAALNTGIRVARGELVAFLDADDVWLADKLARQRARLEARPEIDVTSGRAQNFWDAAMAAPTPLVAERLAEPFPAPGLTMLARRVAFDTIGLFRTERAHSYAADWLLRAREQGAVIDEDAAVLVRRRLHPGNRSRHLTASSREEFLLLLKEHLDRRRREGN